MEQVAGVTSYLETAVSPDAQWVAWSQSTLPANQGYYVFLPNPRGSAGFGEKFKRANVKDMGGAGCADLLSYYGENGIDEWLIPYFGASVYDDPAVYAKSSPITFIKHVHTPTLLIVGDSDVESPPPQSYEYWHALRTLGVKTELVIYPHEGHEFSDPAHVLDRSQRIVNGFDENMPPSPKSQ